MVQNSQRQPRYSNSVAAPASITQYHWPRIIGALVVVVAILATLLHFLLSAERQDGMEQISGDKPRAVVKQDEEVTQELVQTEHPVDEGAVTSQPVAVVASPAPDSSTPQRTTIAIPLVVDGGAGKPSGVVSSARTDVGNLVTEAERASVGSASLPSEPAAAGISKMKPAAAPALPSDLVLPTEPEAGEEEARSTFSGLDLSKADKRIGKAQFTSGLREYEPIDQIDQKMVLHESGVMRVYFFTELRNLKGKTVLHEWKRNGKTVATIRIRPYLSPMRASSSKFIDRRMGGDWTVTVKTATGQTLGVFPFEVILPPSLARN